MEKEHITVSVAMTTYNGKKFLLEQIDSILNQTYKIDEIVICDDGSTDGTRELLRNLEATYLGLIKVLYNDTNLGYARNFWKAINETTSQVVFLSDQDDIWLHDKVEKMIEVFRNEEVLTLNSGYMLIDDQKNVISNYKTIKFKEDGRCKSIDFIDFIRSPRYPGMTMAIRKSFFDEVKGTNEDFIFAHDWILNNIAAYQGGMFFLNEITTLYRQSGNNTYGVSSSTGRKDALNRRIKIIEDEYSLAEILETMYSETKYNCFIKKMKLCIKKRRKYVKERKLLQIILHYIFNFKYISLRDFLGDGYVCVK